MDEALTELINRARSGDPEARGAALAQTYQMLKGIALRLGAAPGVTLSSTVVVHEAFLRLFGNEAAPLVDRRHFFNLAARAMRQVLVDAARERHAQKRGSGWQRVELEGVDCSAEGGDLLSLDQALARLERFDPTLVELVEAYFFAGLPFATIAEQCGSSERSVRRQWALARSFLQDQLSGKSSNADTDD